MEKQIKIALAGNPNCGKTTMFNALTGSNVSSSATGRASRFKRRNRCCSDSIVFPY